ncbi:hypothetical protein THII_0817 [Thioploca ingrica]|uniref:Secreted protein n=1 Tax=Thioploca ingrica TaxID=40754 RepID=A0A090ADZ7_9GAMM|nr:hypothetical protein THII_0817 [Thioploca ingrica]
MSQETFRKTPLALAMGTVFTVSLAQTAIANTQDNPFGMSDLSSGYMVAEAKGSEGKCGEGKCGALTEDDKALLDAMSPTEKEQLKQSVTEMMTQMEGMSAEDRKAKMKAMTPQQQAMMKMIKAEKIAAEGNKGKEGQCGEGKCGSKK